MDSFATPSRPKIARVSPSLPEDGVTPVLLFPMTPTSTKHEKTTPKRPLQDVSNSHSQALRSQSTPINWDKCFICQKTYCKDSKRMFAITTPEREADLRNKATVLEDEDMQRKIDGISLLGRKYHKLCLERYLQGSAKAKPSPDRGITQAKNQMSQGLTDIFDEVGISLKKGFAFRLSDIHQRCKQLGASHKAFNLQRQLQDYFGDSINVIPQHGQGRSNIIVSSSISMVDAIQAALNLTENESSPDLDYADEPSEDALLSVVNRIRTELDNLQEDKQKKKDSSYNYPSPSDISKPVTRSPTLCSLLNLLIDDSSADKKTRDMLMDVIEYSYGKEKYITNFHLSIATHFFHQYGRRDIIDTLNSLKLSISYDELRRFMTSAAAQVIQQDTVIPYGIIPRQEGGKLIQEGADNIDINPETKDGLTSFHALGRVVFQTQDGNQQLSDGLEITRNKGKTLPMADVESICDQMLSCPRVIKKIQPPRERNIWNTIQRLQLGNFKIDVKDLSWVLKRFIQAMNTEENEDPLIPFWTGYNAARAEKTREFTKHSYPPIIDQKPTDPDTIYTCMARSKQMAQGLGQASAVQTMDQQLYAIAQQIKWACPNEFSGHVLQLGGFHLLSTMIACIGKLWGDAGLFELLVDSEAFAGNSVQLMLQGKQFKRATKGLILSYEVLMDVLLDVCFQDETLSCEMEHYEVTSESLLRMHSALEQFIEAKQKTNATFRFWWMYIEAVSIVMINIRAIRDGDFLLYQQSIYEMIPYFFACNRQNYARYSPIYLWDMSNLPTFVSEAFQNGEFAVKHTNNPFNGVWSDMATENTIIKDTKVSNGPVGRTLKKSALCRWAIDCHLMNVYSVEFKNFLGVFPIEDEHDECLPASIREDHILVKQMKQHLIQNMTNPFTTEGEIIFHLASGQHAPPEIAKSLLGSVEKGKIMFKEFVKSCLEEEGSKNFHEKITRNPLKTFSTGLTNDKSPIQKSQMSMEVTFRRALSITKCRDFDMNQLMSLPIGPMPPSLFYDNGSIRKTTKADLLHTLELKVAQSVKTEVTLEKDSDCCVIRDAMAMIQGISGDRFQSFEKLAKCYADKLFTNFGTCSTVIEVFDQYNETSIKSTERDKRGKRLVPNGGHNYQVLPNRKVPNWRHFLAVADNKVRLKAFLTAHLTADARRLKENEKLIIAGGLYDGKTVQFVSDTGVHEVESQFSNHEEADTRILLHCILFNNSLERKSGRIVVQSSDTDVHVILVHHFKKLTNIKELYMEVNMFSSSHRFIPVHELADELGEDFCGALPIVHAITGCDSCSSFFSVGKRKAANLLQGYRPEKLQALEQRNEEALIQFVMELYQKKYNGITYLQLRCNLAKSRLPLARIPPSQPALTQHILRASYQAGIWMQADKNYIEESSPVGNGWSQNEDGSLEPTKFLGPTAANQLDSMICSCKRVCKDNCKCKMNNLACCSLCSCLAECANAEEPVS